jgi:hypothetical protein
MIPSERQKVISQTPAKESAINKLGLVIATVRRAEKMIPASPEISVENTPALAVEQPVTLLPINSKSIAKAYNDSKSEKQKMAEVNAKEINTPIKTKYNRFQTAAEQAEIPDCLAPQGAGGIGLFAIPVIAFQAATGKCK